MYVFIKHKNQKDSADMEKDSFITVDNEVITEFTEKKSVFISSVFTVQTVDEAEAAIAAVKAKYQDATHNCSGYILRTGGVKRFSDDGEPSGTAGMPILNVIEKMGFVNTLVVVTRYFGGIKLGAGGLVRAYSTAAAQALTQAGKTEYIKGVRATVEVDYDDFANTERLLLQSGCIIDSKSFESGVIMKVRTYEDWESIAKSVNDLCRGGALIDIEENIYIKKTNRGTE